MEYCQGFLLQNMVALLTYDDSVKRLMFAKKIPNHDVLDGLLFTLQSRLKARKAASGLLINSPQQQQQKNVVHHRSSGGVVLNGQNNVSKKPK